MENWEGLGDFLVLFNIVKKKYKISKYEKKLKIPHSEIVVTNYYKMISLLKEYDIYEYLNDDSFQLLFIKMIFDGTMDAIEFNFEYLRQLNVEKGINIINNVNKFVKLFSCRNYSLINCPLSSIELTHSLVFDAVSSETIKEKYGAPDQFVYILDRYASGKEYPELFRRVFPFVERSSCNWIGMKLAESISLQNAIDLCNEVMISEVTRFPYGVNVPTLYSAKSWEDVVFLKGRYSNMPGYSWSNIFYSLKQLNCFFTIFGSFTYLFKRMESINRNLYNGNFNLLDFFMKPENMPLFDKLVCSLDSYIDYREYKLAKVVDYNDIVVELVNELSSKLFFYSSLYQLRNDASVFVGNYHTIDVLKIIAQIKKDELDGIITNEEALNKCNRLLAYFKDIRLNKKDNVNFYIARNDFTNLLSSVEYDSSDIDEHNFGLYISLCDDYFEKSDSVFLSVSDFILNTLKYNNGVISDKIRKLIVTDFNILNIVDFDLSTISAVHRILNQQEIYKKLVFISDLHTCAAFDFENFDLFAQNLDSDIIFAIFDAMAIRYHSRIKFSGFYSSVKSEYIEREKGIYQLKELFRKGIMNWERDRIHVYNYFIYLENNLAHDIDESVLNYYFKDQDYFSPGFDSMKSKIDKFFKDAEELMKNNHISNSSDGLLDYVYSILGNENSVSEKIYLIERYIGCNETSLVTDFVNSISNNLDSCLLYLKLLKEKNQDFKYKSDYAINIINDFYSKLKTIRIENNTYDPENLQLTKDEQKAFYERFGYLIDIRYDSGDDKRDGMAVLYIMDKYMEVLHSVHLKNMPRIIVESFNNKEVDLDENIDFLFDNCHLKVAENNRQSILINSNFNITEDTYSILEHEFENAPDFIDNNSIYDWIRDYSFCPNFPDFAYYYICRCLRFWNEKNIMGNEHKVRLTQ